MRRPLRRGLLAAFVLALPTGATAERLAVRVGVTTPYSECWCRGNDRRFAVGETTCLAAPAGPRQATCAMDQNVTSWRFSETACPDS
jgi:hypothetical protein